MIQRNHYDAIIVGGGFFGTYVADHLARRGAKVLVLERERELLSRASLNNQARVHRGYHYPRSVLTALRSAVNFARFVTDFENCVDRTIPTYYAIARHHSNVNAAQYRRFCETVGAPLSAPPRNVERLFDRDAVEAIFAVDEPVFDAVALRGEMMRRLDRSGVEVQMGVSVDRVERGPRVHVTARDGEAMVLTAPTVFVCCYSLTNVLLKRAGLAGAALKHEMVEMAYVEPPPELAGIGVTVMCGPFFSLMPFPSRGLHTLSHVRYTPHGSWSDAVGGENPDDVFAQYARQSRFPQMVRDAARYLPAIRDSRHVDSMWEVKTVLVASENNDSRPILYVEPPETPGTIYIMGAKIDNVYDVCDVYDSTRPAHV